MQSVKNERARYDLLQPLSDASEKFVNIIKNMSLSLILHRVRNPDGPD